MEHQFLEAGKSRREPDSADYSQTSLTKLNLFPIQIPCPYRPFSPLLYALINCILLSPMILPKAVFRPRSAVQHFVCAPHPGVLVTCEDGRPRGPLVLGHGAPGARDIVCI